MKHDELAAVILAAGKGTRMKSEQPKVLHPIAGKPMVTFPVAGALKHGCQPTVLVVGHGAEAVQAELAEDPVSFALQSEQLGTGHALLCARQALQEFSGTLLLLCGDVPLLRDETLERLIAEHEKTRAAVTVLTAELSQPFGYGRILREGDEVLGIVEEKDASSEQKTIREINTGIYAFEAPFVFEALSGVGCDNAQREYYLTDVLAAARAAGRRVGAVVLEDADEAMGINDRVQLAQASALMRRRINENLMRAGVSFIDPEQTYIEPQVEIGPDSVIYPGVCLGGDTRIGSGCLIEAQVTIRDCQLADNVHVKPGSVLEGSRVGSDTAIGPMAHLRPGTVLAGHNKIGNFVETKKAHIGLGSKASHLTYIGDAELGANVNIGCGTITCNYDGVNKHKTVIEDDVFVGSDTQFVAPVHIGRNSLIGAGSTITKDVPPNALALSRSQQRVVADWRLRHDPKCKNKD
ncbi:glucosamine-1-phosphate N-acetyltransferase and N-acetylglucosamine-1-phosphate uridylyltransferase [Syntrophotalea carbinolica DSM 2380]|uniref:Bifunctional protein GlmU n=1 Tax=Syntrophotalea carbinolica (strain DSM 2380 / NBRC 103641 / GraBd1) TaxID=338963 RepID=GLMU_SYNC1|nr:bifunctional UDP-N-acetylglucosamine diphosphorylase/glucosamine-1-phosphate N-acetyltransferase GlmU [Syntrophotalea carbinolica]Q3A0D8.1 RecName: Full=Bifunctional protein GlmU; Includes: RecName: Full=UDP-N-acetylglucosamine pyrophosphorylase; AltName: Full=N-acetylglucosamine-1-phosphate uridyltransferase; Includes: RecName: Full=Glucosamine-1-phosphate N-acetyltransferase [Syntrophotalea carbinolica DSM 2380]ABA90169.1 glucosamine-1-phosphate N-acetyltransferase and N-acetylglucosamine-1-